MSNGNECWSGAESCWRGVGATTLEVTELTDAAPLGVEWAMEIPP